MFAKIIKIVLTCPDLFYMRKKIISLPIDIREKKYEIFTRFYGFGKDSWEARTTPRREAFRAFSSVAEIKERLNERNIKNEGIGSI